MDKFNFAEVWKKLQEAKTDLPVKLANTAQNYFASTFRKGGFDGKAWAEVERRKPGTPEYMYPKNSGLARRKRGILIGSTRDLIDSMRHSIREVNWEQIVLGTDVPYAAYHNEGTSRLPKRQFIGDSQELKEKINKQITEALNKVFK